MPKVIYKQGMHPNSRNGFQKGHKNFGGFQKGHLVLKEWREKSSERMSGKNSPFWQGGKSFGEKRKKYLRNWWNNKYRKDNQFRLGRCIKINIYQSLKERKLGHSWETLVGYTLQDLIMRLEFNFDKKMSWENYGSYWTIDHKKPQSLFHFNSVEEQAFKDCWCLANLQPMEKIENIKKSNNY